MLERHHDRLLPPLQGQGPLPAPCRQREVIDADDGLYQCLVETATEAETGADFYHLVRNHIIDGPISWTKMRRTLVFFENSLDANDAAILHFDIQELRMQLQALRDSADPFATAISAGEKHMSIEGLQAVSSPNRRSFGASCLWSDPCGPSRVLWSSSTRRHIQFYLDRLAQQCDGCTLLVVSMDLIISKEYGDAMNEETCEYWLHAIGQRWVIACISGPPCESWSIARGVRVTPELNEHPEDARPSGPRIIRDIDHLWGCDGAALRELRQLCVGNALLGVALLTVIELAISNGFALLEDPAEPIHDERAASCRINLAIAYSTGDYSFTACRDREIFSGIDGSSLGQADEFALCESTVHFARSAPGPGT